MYVWLSLGIVTVLLGMALYALKQKEKHISSTPRMKEDTNYFDLNQSKHFKKSWYTALATTVIFVPCIVINFFMLGTDIFIGTLCIVSNLASTYALRLQMIAPEINHKKITISTLISNIAILSAIVYLIAKIVMV